MDIITHQLIDNELCGKPVMVENGKSRVECTTTPRMAADDSGLVHGGFIFGLADYAAMLAVNHPNVVLGGADVKFLKPVKAGESVYAQASVTSVSGKMQIVSVAVKREDEVVFKGDFSCFILEKHVLG
ncbi:thioesterase [Desulfobacter hydrogenophilus]|uniref:Thioesterase n=1 Tax=Desulfobacter hydrogenophilus TaxID=2291 RepID=A0A328FA88_9BACT|nr:PaaI family thioesterase [Desulfobacter hydrogenophilus]NDY72532.1 PaaI family thioesterase [Desulfobacter hydrogenophilus]QBH14137.1 PaaI family thioesterase [Desulfobacter hydrogenophilus]RAM01574.1 thioesterase [Desulfobacter hydrogenophilus]